MESGQKQTLHTHLSNAVCWYEGLLRLAPIIQCVHCFSFVPRPCDLDTRLLLCVHNYLLAMTSLTDSAAEMLEGSHHRQ